MRKRTALTAAVVKDCFAEAIIGHRLPLPDDEACEWVAKNIAKYVPQIGTIVRSPTLGLAEKYARLFLRHLPSARAVIEERYRDVDGPWLRDPADNAHFGALVDFASAQRAVSALLSRYGDEKPRKFTWHDVANLAAAYAGSAWRQAGTPARDAGPDSALCVFAHRVLGAVGIYQSEATVAEALRGRAGPAAHERKRRKKVVEIRSE
jgi:hypothetical protein